MIRIKKATDENIDELMGLRLELIKEIKGLDEAYAFPQTFVESNMKFFLSDNCTAYIAYDEEAVGCAAICYYDVLPTFDHPSGKRAHIMNVYTKKEFRRQGLASTLIYMLVDEAKEKGVTEITLDSADSTKSLYYKNGFTNSKEGMVMDINLLLRQNIERAQRTGCKMPSCVHCS